MSNTTSLVQRLVEWLTEALERAQAHDRDRYVDSPLNPREASQRSTASSTRRAACSADSLTPAHAAVCQIG